MEGRSLLVLLTAGLALQGGHALIAQAGQAQGRGTAPAARTAPVTVAPGPGKRMVPIPADKYTPDQRKAAADLKARWPDRSELGQSEEMALRVPEYVVPLRAFTDHQRDRSVIGKKMSEFVISITGRQWTQNRVWGGHSSGALRAGVDPDTIKELGEGRRPSKMTEDEALVYDFLDELNRTRGVSDTTYAKMLAKFGEPGIIEIITTHATYAYLAMMFNVGHEPATGEVLAPLPR